MRRTFAFCSVAGVLALVGCSGANSVAPSGGSRVAVLITDSFREDFAHVWATIYHVDLVSQSGATIPLFDDTAGHQIDLKTLRDAAGARFSFLGSTTIPAGTYTAIKVTVGSTMQLFQNGVAVGNPLPVDSSIPTDASGKPVLSLNFEHPKAIDASTANLVIDFDLAHFIVKNSKVLPALKEGGEDGLHDPARHNSAPYHGAVSNLTGTAPVLTFTLTRPDGTSVTVTTSASTALFGKLALANGGRVEAWGTYDAATQTLVATQLEVEDPNAVHAPRVAGAVTNIDATAGTFTLSTQKACGMLPPKTTVNVVTNASTVYHSDSGSTLTQSDFFTALATTPSVMVEGAYDTATNTFTATVANIIDHNHDGGWHPGDNHFRDGGNGEDWGHGLLHH